MGLVKRPKSRFHSGGATSGNIPRTMNNLKKHVTETPDGKRVKSDERKGPLAGTRNMV